MQKPWIQTIPLLKYYYQQINGGIIKPWHSVQILHHRHGPHYKIQLITRYTFLLIRKFCSKLSLRPPASLQAAELCDVKWWMVVLRVFAPFRS